MPLNVFRDAWRDEANFTYIADAGWHFKTLAVQEIGEIVINDEFEIVNRVFN